MSAVRRYVRFAALGDSFTYGLGDLVSQQSRGWARLLGQAIAGDHDISFLNVARPGATVAELRAEQLPDALDHRPTLASLIVGLNDTLRSTWEPAGVREDLFDVADQLTCQGAQLLTVHFHDHGQVFGLPRFVRGPLARRIDELNAVYDDLHTTYGGLRIDLASHPGVLDPEFWSVDRLHPSELGHRAVAHEFAALLEQHGLPFEPPPLELDGDASNRRDKLRLLAVEGVPWIARRCRDLGPALARRALRNVRPGSEPTPTRGGFQRARATS